jgi:hypothetical protein
METERGLLMPHKWEEEYMVNSGRTQERYDSEVAGIDDIIVKYKGLEAWVSAHHFQMVCPKAVIQEVLGEMLPNGWSEDIMGRMVEMDDRMDDKGYLRFCTRQQTVRLMGNAISDEVAALAKESGLDVQAANVNQQKGGIMAKLVNVRGVRGVLQRVVNWIYKLLNE